MQRTEWEFEYQAGDLLAAAQKEFDRREERIEYWKEQREQVLEKLKNEGLDITRWNEGEYTKASVGTRIDVGFDAKLMGRLQECQKYLERAREEKKEFAMWIQAFGNCQDTQGFKLDAPDISYFGLGRSVEPDFVAPEDAEARQGDETTPSAPRRISTPAV